MTSSSLDGLDLDALDRHLRDVGIPRAGELRAELISGGRSNLTFLVSDDASKWVLRRPPLHGLTPSAHDMAREYRVVAALEDTPVPVARAVTMRDDDSVLGAPFQMVEYVPGRVVRSAPELEALGDKETLSDCVDELIRVLADLHAVDPAAVGLADFGKPTGYLERQVRRWGSQWELVRLAEDERDGDVERLHSALAQAVPEQSRTSIVHGDYRIDNTILDSEDATRVRAVLDWEMSTLGDPLSDAALMCVYRHPMFDLVHADAAWTSPLLPSADEMAQRYSVISGQPLGHWDFYMALAYFKLAIIAAGIDYRARMGGGAASGDARTRSRRRSVAPLDCRRFIAHAGFDGLIDRGVRPNPRWRESPRRQGGPHPSETCADRHADGSDEASTSRRRDSTSIITAPTTLEFQIAVAPHPGAEVTESLSFMLNGKEIQAPRSPATTATGSTSSTPPGSLKASYRATIIGQSDPAPITEHRPVDLPAAQSLRRGRQVLRFRRNGVR